VDRARIGCIGHSHGGYGTLLAMLFDERIRAGVISCGVTLLRADPTPERWWRRTALIPRLGFYEGQIAQAPLDFHHWLALAAPRPLMVSVALKDRIFPRTDQVPPALEMAREVYRLYDAADALHTHVFDGGHGFPRDARTQAYELLEHALK
jgi:dienelactone hydrolase